MTTNPTNLEKFALALHAANTRTNLPTDEQLAEVHWQLRCVTAKKRGSK